MRTSYLLFGLLLLILAPLAAAVNVSTCSNLASAGTTYTLNTSLTDNQSSGICLDIQADGITLDCQGNTISSSVAMNNIVGINVRNHNNIVIKNCDVAAYHYNINLTNVSAAVIDNITSRSATNAAGTLGAGVQIKNSNNINVTNSVFSLNLRDGILVDTSSDVLTASSSFIGNSVYGVHCAGSNRTTVQNSNFTYFYTVFPFPMLSVSNYGFFESFCNSSLVNNSRFIEHNIAAVHSESNSANLVVNNSRFGDPSDSWPNNRGINLWTSSNAKIENNIFNLSSSTSDRYAIYLNQSNSTWIYKNNFNRFNQTVYATLSGSTTILNNTMSVLSSSSVSNTAIYFINYYGNNVIENNTMNGNTYGNGIWMYNKRDANVDRIFSNNISKTVYTIDYYNGSTATISNNIIDSGFLPIYVRNCSQGSNARINISNNLMTVSGFNILGTGIKVDSSGASINISGNNMTGMTASGGIAINSMTSADSSSMVIANNRIINVDNSTGIFTFATGIYFGSSTVFSGVIENNLIQNVSVSDDSGTAMGIMIEPPSKLGSGARITGNSIIGVDTGYGMYLPSVGSVTGINVSNNLITNLSTVEYGVGIYAQNLNLSTVSSNNISGIAQPGGAFATVAGIWCTDCVNTNMTSNRLERISTGAPAATTAMGILIYNGLIASSQINISNNLINRTSNAIYIFGNSNNIFIATNTIDNFGNGIYVIDVNSTVVENNNIYNRVVEASDSYGIAGGAVFNSLVSSNIIRNNYLENTNSYLAPKHYYPIYFTGNLSGSAIQNNTVRSIFDDGIHVDNAMLGSFNITQNRINRTDRTVTTSTGLKIQDCNGTQITQNNVSDTYANVYINTSANILFDRNLISYGYGGFTMRIVNDSMVSNNVAHDNAIGFSAIGGTRNTFINNTGYDNNYSPPGVGFSISGTNSNLINNTAYGHTGGGYGFIISGSNNNLSGCNSTGNSEGIVYSGASMILNNFSASGNLVYGLDLQDSDVTGASVHLFNNGIDFIVTTSAPHTISFSSIVFDSPAGNYQNYTNLTLTDNLVSGDSYTINWSSNHAALQPGYVSFYQKYVNISLTSGFTGIIDSIIWNWRDAETPSWPHNENRLSLWKYNSSGWTLLNSTPDAGNNRLSQTNMIPGSDYTILEAINCPVINESDSYQMNSSFYGSPNDASEVPAGGTTCVKIITSNVLLDCNGFSIYNNGTTGTTRAILLNGSITNVTLRNCPVLVNYTEGVDVYKSTGSVLSNITAYNNSDNGFYIESSSSNINMTGDTAYNNARGFYIVGGSSFNLSNNIAYNNSASGFVTVGGPSSIYFGNNTAYTNFYGYQLYGSEINVIGNTAHDNGGDGFQFYFSNGNVSFNNAYGNSGGSGFYLDSNSNIALTSNNASTNWYAGFFFYKTTNMNLTNNIAHDNAYGIALQEQSSGSVFNTNTVYANTRGFFLDRSNYSNFTSNTVYGGTRGFYLTGSSNNLFNGNRVENSTERAFYLFSSSNFNNLFSNYVYNQTVAYYVQTSANNTLFNNTARRSSDDGFMLLSSSNSTLVNNTAIDSINEAFFFNGGSYDLAIGNNVSGVTGTAFRLLASSNETLNNNTASGTSFAGVYLSGSSDNMIKNNIVSNAGQYGITIQLASSNNNFLQNNLSGSQNGFDFLGATGPNNLINNVVYGNTVRGTYLSDSGNTLITGDRFFNNGLDFVMSSSGGVYVVNLSAVIFANPTGTLENYTNLTINDATGVPAEIYSINWTTNSSTPLDTIFSFEQKYLNISKGTGNPSIDSITWTWTTTEVANKSYYNENKFQIWRYDSAGWINMNATLNTGTHTLNLSNVLPASDYGIMQSNLSECMLINESGSYRLKNNLFGAPIDVSDIPPFGGTTCIKIIVPNVDLDCNGFNISNNGTAGTTRAIATNGSVTSNVTIRNCPVLTNYNYSVDLYASTGVVIRNTTAFNNSRGFQLVNCVGVNLTGDTAYNNSQYGFYGWGSNFTNMSNNLAYNQGSNGFRILGGSNYYFGNNTAFNDTLGFYISSDLVYAVANTVHDSTSDGLQIYGTNGIYTLNNVYNNANDGFLIAGTNNTFFLNNASGSGGGYAGFWLLSAVSANLTNNIAHDNGHGIALQDMSSGSIFNGNTVYNNGNDGFYLLRSNYSNFTSNIAYNNTVYGFELVESSSNLFTNDQAYNTTTRDGFEFNTGSNNNLIVNATSYGHLLGSGFAVQLGCFNNTFTDSRAYNNTYYGFFSDSSNNTNWLNNIAYNNTVSGFILQVGSNDSYVLNNTAYGNLAEGFEILDSHGGTFINNTARDNLQYGFKLTDSDYSVLSNNLAYNNSWTGVYLQTCMNNILANNTAYNNSQDGFLVIDSNNLIGSYVTAYGNGLIGFYMDGVNDSMVLNCSSHDNIQEGLRLEDSFNTTLFDCTSYGNSYGLRMLSSNDTNATNVHLYNNTADLYLFNGVAVPSLTLNFANITFDNPYATTVPFTNYTSLSFSDSFVGGTTYFFNWTADPGGYPVTHVPFEQKFVNITQLAGTDTLDIITWTWTAAEVSAQPYYNESRFQLWKMNSSGWSQRTDAVLNMTLHTLTVANFAPGSDYGILMNNASECMVVSANGTYVMNSDLVGAPFDAAPLNGTVCVKITASDVDFDCNGHTITNNESTITSYRYGIETNGSVTNVTIRNCGGVSLYSTGIEVYESNDTHVLNSSVHAIEEFGIDLQNSENSSAVGNTLHDVFRSIRLYEAKYSLVANNTVYNSTFPPGPERPYGINTKNSSFNTFINNTISFTFFGISLQGDRATNNVYINNTVFNATYAAYSLGIGSDSGSFNNFTDNEIYNCISGFGFTQLAIGNIFTHNYVHDNIYGFALLNLGAANYFYNNTAVNNSDTGFYFTNVTGQVLAGNNASGSGINDGFGFYNSTNISLSGDMAFDNDYAGFYFENTTNSVVNGVTAYDNEYYGVAFYDSSNYNVVENSTAWGANSTSIFEPGSAFGTANSNNINFTNNTAFNSTFGIGIAYSDTVAVVNNTAYGCVYDPDLSSGLGVAYSTNVLVRDNVAYQNVHGVGLLTADDNTVFNNTLYDNNFTGVAIISDSNRNNVTNNTIYNNTYGIAGQSATFNLLSGNDVSNSSLFGIYLQDAENNVIESNAAYGNLWHGIFLNNASNNNITTNNASNNSMVGIYIQNSTGNIVLNCVADNNPADGVYLVFSQYNNLAYNNASLNVVGFFLNYSDNNLLTGNIANNNTGKGFFLDPSSYNNLTDNIAYNNTDDGFMLDTGSIYNLLLNNTAYYNGNAGFMVTDSFGSNHNQLINNTAYLNLVGIGVESSQYNDLIHNTAYDNLAGFMLDQANNTLVANNSAVNNSVGYYILATNDSTFITNLASNNTLAGFYANDSHYNIFSGDQVYGQNLSAANNSIGFYLNNSNYNQVDSLTLANNHLGLWLENSSNNNITNSNASEGFYGFVLNQGSDFNLLAGCSAINFIDDDNTSDPAKLYGGKGFFVRDSNNNVLVNNFAQNASSTNFAVFNANNTVISGNNATGPYGMGFDLGDVINLTITNNLAYGIQNATVDAPAGYILEGVWQTYFADNSAYDSILGLIVVEDIYDSTLARSTFYNNSDIGMSVFGGSNVTLINMTVHGTGAAPNGIGVNLGVLFNSTITNLQSYDNQNFGVLAGLMENVSIINLQSYNNNLGLIIYNVTAVSVTNAEVFNNTAVGLYFSALNDTNFTAVHLYNNGFDVQVNNSGADAGTVSFEQLYFDNPADSYDNYTWITMLDEVAANEEYYMNWSAQPPGVLPNISNRNYTIFHNKFLEITNLTDISIDNIAWHWTVGEEANYTPARLELWKNNAGVWSNTNATRNLSTRTLSLTNYSNFSIFGILQAPPPVIPDGGSSSCSKNPLITIINTSCPDNKITVRVTAGGVPVDGATVSMCRPALPCVNRDTNAAGEATFPVPSDGSYTFSYSGDSVYCPAPDKTTSYSLCLAGCLDDNDCSATQYCDRPTINPGACKPVACGCGEVYEHTCHPYECCSNSDCSEGDSCMAHICKPKEKPKCTDNSCCQADEYYSVAKASCDKIKQGTCGYISNHSWFDYECCYDTDCPEAYQIITNETGFVGNEHGMTVLGPSCANHACGIAVGRRNITIQDPTGKKFQLETDENGYAKFLLENKGIYSLLLYKQQKVAANASVLGLEHGVIPKPPLSIYDVIQNCWWILLVIAAIIIGYIVYRRRTGKKYKFQ